MAFHLPLVISGLSALSGACVGSVSEPIHNEAAGPPASGVDAAVVSDARTGSDGNAAAPETGDAPTARTDGGSVMADAAPASDGTPTVSFGPNARTFTTPIDVTIESSDPAATIHYTLDDKPPTTASPKYSGPIPITASTVVRAFAVSPRGGAGAVHNTAFLKLEADVASFDSDIPIVVLHSALKRVGAKSDGVRAGTVTVFEPDPGTRRASLRNAPTLSARMGINVRGSSSSGWPKRPYKVETWGGDKNEDAAASFLGMPAESDWAFFPGWNFDRTLVRNQVMFSLSNKLGHYAPRTRVAEVFYTDGGRGVALADYVGLYVVMETIKIDKNRVALKKLDALANAAPDVTGGYIFKVDRVEGSDMGLNAGYGPNGLYNSACPSGVRGLCAITAYPSRVAFHRPSEMELTPMQRTYLRDTLNAFATALSNKTYDAQIDVQSFIDQHILYLLSKNADGLRLSSFAYKDRGGKIVGGPVWDFDRSLGCTHDSRCREPERWDGTNITNDFTNYFHFGWWRGLFADDAFRKAYWDRFRALHAGDLSDAKVQAVIDEEVAKLGKVAPARNAMRWPEDAPSGGHAAEVGRLKAWVSRRLQWIGGCLALADPAACTVP